jgi:hypothetical protein
VGAEAAGASGRARRLPRSLRCFHDGCHFNAGGARTAGTLLADFLVGTGAVPGERIVPGVSVRIRARAPRPR